MHVVARGRVFIARHRWVYWLVTTILAATTGLVVKGRLDDLEAERTAWHDSRTVLIASVDLTPDGPIAVESVRLPIVAVPPSAVDEIPDDARLHQRVAAGEVLVAADLVQGEGPARHADRDTVVVGIVDPLSPSPTIGLRVRVTSEGVVLASAATIVSVADEVIFVAVAEGSGPVVASAAQAGLASLLFLP